jgi:integrase
MEFTKDTIAALSLPAGKSDLIQFDDDMPGFGIRLRAGGKRVWIVQYRAHERQRRETLGDVRKIDLKAARTAAKKRFAEVALGGDPQKDKAEAKARAAVTVGPLVDRYLAVKKPVVRANTHVANHRYLTNYWKSLHRLQVDAVDRRLVAARLGEIVTEHGTTAAARARQSLSGFFSWLIGEGIAHENPVIGTNNPLAESRSRDRVLTETELRAIWLACRDYDFGRIVRLLMLTAARRDEIGGLRWSEIDLDRGLLNIPGTRTKNHHPLQLTLPAAAVSILRSAPRTEGRDLIFGGGDGPFGAWSYSTLSLGTRIAEMRAGAAMAAWRIHDIRRTVATGMAELGVQPHIVEAVINHRSGHKAGVAGIYNRATYEPEIKRALALWADRLAAIVEDRKTNVASIAAYRAAAT